MEITGTIVAASISQLGTGRDYSNIGVTFVSSDHRAFECKVRKYAISVGEEITTKEAFVKHNLDLLKMEALSLEV